MTVNQHTRLGKGMLTIGFIVALGLLTVIFGRWEEKQYNPNQSHSTATIDGSREVTLKANRMHHYIANGQINGEQVTFLLDTGATTVAIPAELADKMQLPRGAAGYSETANGRVKVRSTVIDELRLGPITLYDIPATINPGMDFDEVLLGMSALKELEITQRNGELTLKQY